MNNNNPKQTLKLLPYGNKVGKPTTYTKKISQQIIKYFQDYQPYDEIPITKTLKDGSRIEKMERQPRGVPGIADLADFLQIPRITVYQWAIKKESFKKLYKKCLDKFREEIIVNNAFLGDYNPTFSIFYLKNKHGYKDRTEVESVQKEAPIMFNTQINQFLQSQDLPEIGKDENMGKFKDSIPGKFSAPK